MLVSIVDGTFVVFINAGDLIPVSRLVHYSRRLGTMPSTDKVPEFMNCNGLLECVALFI